MLTNVSLYCRASKRTLLQWQMTVGNPPSIYIMFVLYSEKYLWLRMKHKGNTCPLPLCAVPINKLNCATIVPPLLSDKARPKRETGEVLSVWCIAYPAIWLNCNISSVGTKCKKACDLHCALGSGFARLY